MSTGELIRLLQAQDPTGELPVCIDNADVHFVTRTEAYYDGRLQQIVRDERGQAVSARVTSQGDKVRIYVFDLESQLFKDPDFPIEVEGSPWVHEEVQRWRESARRERGGAT